MSDPAQPGNFPPANSPADDGLSRTIEIVNKKGLHARASAKFVQIAEQYDASVTVTRGNETVGGTSIMGLMMLAAGPGTLVTIRTRGREAIPAMDALCDLVNGGFGEEE